MAREDASGLFLPLIIVHFLLPKTWTVRQVRRPHAPFVRVGKVIEIRRRVVRDDVIEKIFFARVDDLVRFTGRIQYTIARLQVAREFARANFSSPRDYQIEFPLGSMVVEG